LEPQDFSEYHDNLDERPNEIIVPTIKLKNLGEVEAYINELQQAARCTWGPRKQAMGVPSMSLGDFVKAIGVKEIKDTMRISITMAGNVEVYEDNELMGFIEVREDGGYVEL
jgi:hypothetical protein